jgi:hypothetical protein
VEVPLIDDLPILSGIIKLDQKGMDERTISSVETKPETVVGVNERTGGNPKVAPGQSAMNAGRKESFALTRRGLIMRGAWPGAMSVVSACSPGDKHPERGGLPQH